MATIQIDKTVYEEPSPSDGKRILIMRFWPRGVRKDKVDLWLKDVGTDPKLIKEWKTGKVSWTDFEKRYYSMMKGERQKELVKEIADYARKGSVTFLCTDKDPNRCHRSLLKKLVKAELGK